MNKLPLLLLLAISATTAQSQRTGEWFRQKETQIKYLLEQIAALKTYGEHIRRGYKITSEGLHTIGHFKDSDFKSHQAYFQSLEKVNPVVSHHPQVSESFDLLLMIKGGAGDLIKMLTHSDAFSKQELEYIQRTLMRLLDDGTKTAGMLQAVIGGEGLLMTDKERLTKLEQLNRDLKDQHTFFQSFSGGAALLMVQRKKESMELQKSRAINSLKNK